MKYMALYLMVGLALSAASYAAAEDATKDEQKLERTSTDVDEDAARPEGQKNVESQLKSEYKVDDARIQGLRDQKMGYGEISIALALASKLPGGITDANVAKIMAERNGPPKMGWGQVAKKNGTTVGKINGRVKGVDTAVRKHEKVEGKAHEKSEKSEHHDKAERAERSEKAERHEKSEHPKH